MAESVRAVIEVVENPAAALRDALALAGKEDLVCAAGSLYLVGEIKRIYQRTVKTAGGHDVPENGPPDRGREC